jgi:hypothetical protein
MKPGLRSARSFKRQVFPVGKHDLLDPHAIRADPRGMLRGQLPLLARAARCGQ